jgi:hypothetical protein
MPAESALVVLVPEAEAVVGSYRRRYDPSALQGMPAHITTLYPFLPPGLVDAEVLAVLRECYAEFSPFHFSLTAIRRFEAGVLYLMPESAEIFRELTRAAWSKYPQTPPYGGKHSGIEPHLTVAHLAEKQGLDQVAGDFVRTVEKKLPIRVATNEVALMDNKSGRWQVREKLALGR